MCREQRIPIYCLPSHSLQFPLLLIPCINVVHLLQLMSQYWCIIINESPQFTLGFTPVVVHSVGCDKCIMACIHHYQIIQNSFTALKILCAPPVISPPSQTLAITDIFIASIVLPFPECHIVEFLQYVASQIDFFRLAICVYDSLMSLVAWWFILFYSWMIFHCMDVPHFVYPFTYWRTSSKIWKLWIRLQ